MRQVLKAKTGFDLCYIFPGWHLSELPRQLTQFSKSVQICTVSFCNDLALQNPMRLRNTQTSSFITYTYEDTQSAFKSAASANFAIPAKPINY